MSRRRVTEIQPVMVEYDTNSGQGFSGGCATVIQFGTKVVDTHGAVTNPASSWLFNAPKSGIYIISAHAFILGFDPVNPSDFITMQANINGNAEAIDTSILRSSASVDMILGGTIIKALDRNDTVSISLTNNGNSGGILTNGSSNNWVKICEVKK